MNNLNKIEVKKKLCINKTRNRFFKDTKKIYSLTIKLVKNKMTEILKININKEDCSLGKFQQK